MAILIFVAVEFLARSWGVMPSVRDGPELWSDARDRVDEGNGPKLIFVGASRSAFGTDLDIARKVTGADVVQLAIRGGGLIPALHDLAEHPPDEGWVVVSFAAPSLEPQTAALTTSRVEFYRGQWRTALRWEQAIDAHLQATSAARRGVDRLHDAVRQWILGPTAGPGDRSVVTYDRQVLASRAALQETIAGMRASDRARSYERVRAQHHLDPPRWRRFLGAVIDDVDRLHARGIRVAFIRYPSSEPHRSIEERFYPRTSYWDELARACDCHECTTVHFEDFERLRHFVAEDGSHLPIETRTQFTAEVLAILGEVGFLPMLATAESQVPATVTGATRGSTCAPRGDAVMVLPSL